MKDLKNELKEIEADEIAIREIRNNCEMVILFAKIVSGAYGDLTDEAEKICEEFANLWDLKNHKIGKEIFIDFVKSIVK